MKTIQRSLLPVVSSGTVTRNLRRCFLPAVIVLLGLAGQLHAAGSALFFDGINDFVTFGPAPALGTPTFTIETWFKRTGAGVSTSTGSGGAMAIPLVTTNQDMNYFLGIRAADNVLVADFEEDEGGASPGQNHPIAGITPIANNVWYHAAVTYDGTKWQMFLNGALEAELTVGQPPRADSIQHAALGSALDATGVASGFFNGVLDEVRIWNYARSAQEISANRNSEIVSAAGLLGRWGLDEGSGAITSNSTGTAVTGNLMNGPLWVAGFQTAGGPILTRGPYLQSGTPTSMIIRWRTDVATASLVSLGTAAGQLSTFMNDATLTTEHSVQLTGLQPDTQYFYGVGSPNATLAIGPDYTFFTAPPAGTPQPVRVWVLGDSGEPGANAAAVRDAYMNFNGTRYTDLCLMLGDNAYPNGTDAQYQAALFNMYPAILRQTPLWPTIGNHDTAQIAIPPPALPYFKMFTLPANAEAGGVASGTEKYYSFDYANAHFICLDSMASNRAPSGPMATWLQSDLSSTTQEWIIAFFHHPPYSKGVADSDTTLESIEMRSNILPILEAGGVDLVLSGHSHTYERSFLLNGHYGLSSTLTAAMKVDGGSGRETDSGAYQKPPFNAPNSGTVYVVAATSSDVATGRALDSPAMYISMANLGSVVLDLNAAKLDVMYLRDTGVVADFFTILKNTPNQPPTVALSNPVNGATFSAPAEVTLLATADDPDGHVARVDFLSDGTVIGTATNSPFGGTWSNLPAGTYTLTAMATDDRGASTTSAAVTITVNNPLPPPAPTHLTAIAGDHQAVLAWTASPRATSYTIRRSQTAGGPYLPIATGLTALSYADSALTNGTTYFYVVKASNLGGTSRASNEAGATPSQPVNPALFFDGVNDFVTFGPAPGLGAATFTIETWFKRTGAGVSTKTGVGGMDAIPLVTKGRAQNDGSTRDMNYFLGIRVGDNVLMADFEEGAGGASPGRNHPVAGTTPIASNVWYHAAATYNGTKWQLFLNGLLEAELTVGQPPRSDSIQHAALGSALDSSGAATGFFKGLLDEVRIWNYARSAPLIAAKKNSAIASATGLAGRWGLNEGSGTLASNSAGNNSTGTLAYGPLWVAGVPPPPNPTSLAAQAGYSHVTLTWNASANAAGYAVKRATISGGPYTTMAGGLTGTSYSDGSVSNGTPYFYVVTASNLGGQSGVSNQASATPLAPPPPPAAPAGLVAAPGNARVVLTWNASANATSYSVKRATVATGPFATIASGLTALTYTNTGVTNGTKYYYVATASNAGGESAASKTASATPLAPPAAPTGLVATAVSQATISLTWTDHSSNEFGFKIERSIDGTNFSLIGTVSAGVTSYSSGGLVGNMTYYHRVRAYHSAGNSVYSNVATAKTLP